MIFVILLSGKCLCHCDAFFGIPTYIGSAKRVFLHLTSFPHLKIFIQKRSLQSTTDVIICLITTTFSVLYILLNVMGAIFRISCRVYEDRDKKFFSHFMEVPSRKELFRCLLWGWLYLHCRSCYEHTQCNCCYLLLC